MLQPHTEPGDDFVRIWATGRLDAAEVAPGLAAAVAAAEVRVADRLLVQLAELDGWDPPDRWEAVPANVSRPYVRKLALVGPENARELLDGFAALFPMAQARYYDLGEAPQAAAWLRD